MAKKGEKMTPEQLLVRAAKTKLTWVERTLRAMDHRIVSHRAGDPLFDRPRLEVLQTELRRAIPLLEQAKKNGLPLSELDLMLSDLREKLRELTERN